MQTLTGKSPDAEKDQRQRRWGGRGEMVIASPTKSHESEQTPGDSDGERSLACCSPWGCQESDIT